MTLNMFQLELESWDSWGADGDGLGMNSKSSQQNYNGYNRYSSNKQEPAELEPEPDFFEDMQPQYKKPAKVSGLVPLQNITISLVLYCGLSHEYSCFVAKLKFISRVGTFICYKCFVRTTFP